MNGLTEISDTASDDTTKVAGSFNPPPTAIGIRPHRVIADPESTNPGTSVDRFGGMVLVDSESDNAMNLRRLWELVCPPSEFKVTQCGIVSEPGVKTFAHTWKHRELWSIAAQSKSVPCPPWPEIEIESRHEEIIAVLRWSGRGTVADRLIYLRGLAGEDPEESPIELGSLRAMARFLMSERQLPDPQVGVSPDGFIQIEWRLPTNGILAMEFLPSGLLRFAAVSAPARSGVDRLTVNGTLPKDQALAAIRPFTSSL